MAKKKNKKSKSKKTNKKLDNNISNNGIEQSSTVSSDTTETEKQTSEVLAKIIPDNPDSVQKEDSSIKGEEIKKSEQNSENDNRVPTGQIDDENKETAEQDEQRTPSENIDAPKETVSFSSTKKLPETIKNIILNQENRIPVILVSIIIVTIVFLFVFLPLLKKNNAANYVKEGKNEEALAELSGIVPLFGINDLKKEAETNIVFCLAEELQKTNSKFSADHFKIESITDSTVNLNNDSEKVDFIVTYSNKDASATLTCNAEKSFNGNEWATDKIDIINAEYMVNKDCEESVPNDAVIQKYPDAVFARKGDKEQLYQNFIYTFRSIDNDNPFYYANNEVEVLCTYNISNNKWVVAEMQKTVVSTEEIPFKEFATSIFRIMLPEAWIMKMYEYSYEYDYNDEHRVSYSYSYSWFANKEDMMAYSEKDGGSSLLDIRISADNYNNSYNSYNSNNSVTVNSSALGKGRMREDSFNNTRYCSMTFNPKIKGLTSYFDVNTQFADSDKLLDILNQIKIRNTTYTVEVLISELRIRSYASTSSNIVGHVRKGQKYKATEACDDYQGYRWFKIGENQWIEDLYGEYLSVKYN